MLRGVHFDFDKSDIRPGDAAVLDEDVAKLKATPNVSVNVNGYCDAIGSEEYNLRLSDRRADAVVNYLVRAGFRRASWFLTATERLISSPPMTRKKVPRRIAGSSWCRTNSGS